MSTTYITETITLPITYDPAGDAELAGEEWSRRLRGYGYEIIEVKSYTTSDNPPFYRCDITYKRAQTTEEAKTSGWKKWLLIGVPAAGVALGLTWAITRGKKG
jgi:hypothetical protein